MEPHEATERKDPHTSPTALLDSLLRGEIAAAETYKQALDGIEDHPEATPLRSIQQDHGSAIRFLYDRVSALGGAPSVDSGVWGVFARAVEGAAVILGNAAALRALREGEQQGLSSYEAALRRQDLPPECREHIERSLIPQQRRHIDALSRLVDAHS